MAVTNGESSRFDDSPLAFGLQRFSAGSSATDPVLWRFYVSRFCNRQNALIEIDATPETLRRMRDWLDRAIKTVADDGGRRKPKIEDQLGDE